MTGKKIPWPPFTDEEVIEGSILVLSKDKAEHLAIILEQWREEYGDYNDDPKDEDELLVRSILAQLGKTPNKRDISGW